MNENTIVDEAEENNKEVNPQNVENDESEQDSFLSTGHYFHPSATRRYQYIPRRINNQREVTFKITGNARIPACHVALRGVKAFTSNQVE